MLHHALSFIWKIGSNDVRQGIALYNVLILPTALWILRFKRNDFFFLSLDLCFLSVVTRTSRSSLRGKPWEGEEGSWKQPVNSSYPRQILGERFLSSSPLLSYPFSHSPFPLPLFSQQSSSTPYYVDPSDVLYYFTSILRPLPAEEGRNTLVRDPFFHYERIRLR